MGRLLLYAALGVYLLSLLGAALAIAAARSAPMLPNPPDQQAAALHATTAPGSPSATSSGMRQPIIGFAFSFHHAQDLKPYLRAVDELAAMGINSIQIVTPAFQTDGASEVITIDPQRSAQRQHIIDLIRYARGKGMNTALMPIVLFTNPRGTEWRGKIHPENWDNWWQSYHRTIDYFLAIAVEADASAFSVGSELLSTEKETERWTTLIAKVRQRFSGKLYYSTNWDHYHVPTYWNRLDYIGISCYWDMTTLAKGQAPTAVDLAQRWAQIRKQVLDFSAQQNRPILLTEIGYPSLPWGLKDPWNYVSGSDVKADHQVQARGYEALLAAWQDRLNHALTPSNSGPNTTQEKGEFAGLFFYSWDPYARADDRDTGYGIKGKPAHDLLRRWLAQIPANP